MKRGQTFFQPTRPAARKVSNLSSSPRPPHALLVAPKTPPSPSAGHSILFTFAASPKRTPNLQPLQPPRRLSCRMDRDGSRAATGQGPPAAAAGPTPSRPPPSPGIEALAAGDSVSLATSCDPPLILFAPDYFYVLPMQTIRCPVDLRLS